QAEDGKEERGDDRLEAERERGGGDDDVAKRRLAAVGEGPEAGLGPDAQRDGAGADADDDHREADDDADLERDVAEEDGEPRILRQQALAHGEDLREEGEGHG